MQLPRILFTAPSSASGKTTVTCGILQALMTVLEATPLMPVRILLLKRHKHLLY